MNPTEEQQAAVELACEETDLTIEALAGCGKTTTLKLISDAMPHRSGSYIAFNKAIVEEARSKFPSNVSCSTAHSLAYKAVGYKFRNRLNGERQLFKEVAEILDIKHSLRVRVGGSPVVLSKGEQVAAVKNSVDRFCQGGTDNIEEFHIPVPELLQPWAKEYRKAISDEILGFARKMWKDLNQPHGKIKFSHNNYLKMWQLQNPKIESDFILFDEAQDANGVMLAIVQNQKCQRIYVGDTFQQIYSWNGAVNAMQKTGKGNKCWLSESWRFGQGIADMANLMLKQLGCPVNLVGRGSESAIGDLRGQAETLLFRSNAACVSAMVDTHERNESFHLVGGVSTIESFCEAARRMQRGQWANHPDLNCFLTWGDAVCCSQSPESDGDLSKLVNMIERHGVDRIMRVIRSNESNEKTADRVISTAHKAKGREWDSVQIGGDFPGVLQEEEKRLLYVAATRAKVALDVSSVLHHFTGDPNDDRSERKDLIADREPSC